MSVSEDDDLGFYVDDMDNEAGEPVEECSKSRKRRVPTKPGRSDWCAQPSQFVAEEEAPPKRHRQSESSNFDDEEADDAEAAEGAFGDEEEEEGEEEEEEESEGLNDIYHQDNDEFFGQQPPPPPPNGDDNLAVAVHEEEQDHVMNCFMCLYGNRGFDKLNDTHRNRLSEIYNSSLTTTTLSEDEIGTQLWVYFDRVACPDMERAALDRGRNWVRPPWSLFEARRHVSRIFHPILAIRRELTSISAQKALIMKHCFPLKQNDDGEWVETYDKNANDMLIRLRNQFLSFMRSEPAKMIGGKDTEITTQMLTGMWKDGRKYDVADDWEIN